MVQQAAVSRRARLVARRPLLLAPFELQPQVVVLERSLITELAKGLARDPNRGPAIDRDDREHLERIASGSDRLGVVAVRAACQTRHIGGRRRPLHPGRPAVEVFPVPQRCPIALGANGRDREEHAHDDEFSKEHRSLRRRRPL